MTKAFYRKLYIEYPMAKPKVAKEENPVPVSKKGRDIKVHYIGTDAALHRLDNPGDGKAPLSEQNKKDILAFRDFCLRNNFSEHRVLKYLQTLPTIARILNKDFRACEREDYERVVDWVVQSKFKDWTKQTYTAVLKKFVWWVENQKTREENLRIREHNKKHPKEAKPELEELAAGEYPKCIKWLKTSFKKNSGYRGMELPKELLTEEDALALIKSALNPRDKAMIALLYETGVRAGELLGMRLRDIELGTQSNHASHIMVSGKTGERQLLIVWSAPYLKQWLNEHRFMDDPAHPMWTCINSDKDAESGTGALSYPYLNKLLRDVEARAKTGKPVNPHIFRHTAATRNANFMSQAQLNDYFGWSQGSAMAAVYLHRAGMNTDKALLRAHGVIENEEEFANSELKPKKCVNCKEENDCEARYCNKCGTPLSVEFALDREDKVKQIGELFLKLANRDSAPGELKSALEHLLDPPKRAK